MSAILEIANVTRLYSDGLDKRGIDGVSFDVSAGEVICILGPSGAGKSTLLRVMAGLEVPDSGSVRRPENHLTGYVSQEYTLWPHLTVLENLMLAPKLRGRETDAAIRKEAATLLERFGLSEQASRYPAELSGGQRQRIALLRSIMMKPEVLLLDEITSALDPELTKGVLDLIRALAKDGYAMVLVTHHVSFAMSLADRIIFMRQGEIQKDESALSFFANQSDPEIRSFILDKAKDDDSIEIFKGVEQFQSYHLGLLKRLPEESTIYVAGAVGDTWYAPMGEFYARYEQLRIQKRIGWKMATYDQGDIDRRLVLEYPELNRFRKLPRNIRNPANYNVFGDTVITQIFEDEPTIIQVRNLHVADAYRRFFEELWNMGEDDETATK